MAQHLTPDATRALAILEQHGRHVALALPEVPAEHVLHEAPIILTASRSVVCELLDAGLLVQQGHVYRLRRPNVEHLLPTPSETPPPYALSQAALALHLALTAPGTYVAQTVPGAWYLFQPAHDMRVASPEAIRELRGAGLVAAHPGNPGRYQVVRGIRRQRAAGDAWQTEGHWPGPNEPEAPGANDCGQDDPRAS